MRPDDPQLADTWQPFAEQARAPGWQPTDTIGTAPEPPPPPPLPRLGIAGDDDVEPEYRLGDVLGSGGAAVVFAAEHLPLGRPVAIKALHTRIRHPAALDALVDEARIAGGLEHPNIVPVHALGLDRDQRPLLVMKRIDGEPWSVLLKNPGHRLWARWPGDAIDRAIQVGLRVADALASAHERGVLHRDVKPSNVVLGPTGEVYLVDWGIAARLDADGRVIAPMGGTPSYMAPEQFDPRIPLDVRCDVYLLGASLYTALAGRAPREALGFVELARAAADPAPPLPEAVPAELGSIVARAMAPAPADRFPDIEALRAALVTFLNHRGAIEQAAEAEACRMRYVALRTQADADGARDRLLNEARFGFQAALKAWPDCPAARDGLTALLEASIADDLERGDIASARRALAELPEPHPALEAAIAEAAARARADRDELEASRTLDLELDPRAGSAARRRWLPVIFGILAIGPLRAGILRWSGELDGDLRIERAIVPMVLVVLIEIGLRGQPVAGPGARFNRQLVRLGQVCMLGAAMQWLIGAGLGLPVHRVVFDVLMMQVMAFGVAAVAIDRRLGIAAIGGLGSAMTAFAMPEISELVMVADMAVAVLAFQWIWSHDPPAHDDPGRDPVAR